MAGIYRSSRLGTTPSHSSSTFLRIVLRHTKAPLVACVTTFPPKSGSCTKSNTPRWNYSLWFTILTWTTTYVCWYVICFFVLLGFLVGGGGGINQIYCLSLNALRNEKKCNTYYTYNKILVTLQQSAEANNDMTLCCLCCKSGPISATLYLETIGFVPGEGIPIHVEIENRSGRKISAASVTLLMVNKYVFLTQCLFQESFNTVKCTITNSFAFFSFEFKMRGFCDVTMFFSSDIDTLFIDVWTFTKGSRASVLSVRTVYEYWPPPMEICIINLLHHFSINVDEEQNQNKQFFRFHINCARTMGLLYQPT